MSKEDLNYILEKGSLLVLEHGEYSDRRWDEPIRMLKTVTKGDLAEAFRMAWRLDAKVRERQWGGVPDDPDDYPAGECFGPFLIRAGWAEAVDNVTSWHVGTYSGFLS